MLADTPLEAYRGTWMKVSRPSTFNFRFLKKFKNFFHGGGGGYLGDFFWEEIGTFSVPSYSLTIMENHIGPAISEILSYIQQG